MCKLCVDNAKKHYPDLSSEDLNTLLMCATSFPFGTPEMIESQLVELKSLTDGSLESALILADKQIEEAMANREES